MRILLVNKFHYPAGGAERYVFEWARLLRARGHEVFHFAMRDPRNAACSEERFFVSRVDFFGRGSPFGRASAAARSIYSLEARRNLRRLLRAVRPDAAHLHSFCYQLTPAILSALQEAGVPAVQTSHEYKHACPNQRLYNQRTDTLGEKCAGGRRYMPILARCVRGSLAASAVAVVEAYLDRALRLSDRVIQRIITPSDFMRRKFLEWGVRNSPSGRRVVHIPNFVDVRAYPVARAGGDYILFVGRLVRHKGVLTLIRAMGRLRSCRLLVVGDGPLREEIQRMLNAQNLGNVELLGRRAGAELRELTRRCRALVVPSEWYENCPFVVLEGMAAGRPVIASRIGGIPEMIGHGEHGLLFDPGNAADLVAKIAQVRDNRAFARGLGAAARHRAETVYAPDRHYERVMGVLREVERQS